MKMLSLLLLLQFAVGVAVSEKVDVTFSDVSDADIEVPHAPGRIFVGDIEIDPDRNAVRSKAKKWPNGSVPYLFDDAFPSSIKKKILDAMREIEHDVNGPDSTCIKFTPYNADKNYIHIMRGLGCHSMIGMQGYGRQEVSIGITCERRGVIMHELIHSLGFWHEQNRYDRDDYIDLNLDNVLHSQRGPFARISDKVITTQGIKYDFSSVMHYGPYSFAMVRSIPVITPKPKYFKIPKLGQRIGLSKLDVLKIQRLYGCKEDTSHTVDVHKDDLMSCDFNDGGVCNMKHQAGPFQWTTHKGPSASGPKAGDTNGIDYYLLATASGHKGQTAKISTPSLNKGPVCVMFSVFQAERSSYVNVVASGDKIRTQTITTFRGKKFTFWRHQKINLDIPNGETFQVTFEAHIGSEDVALDDIRIYSGKCI